MIKAALPALLFVATLAGAASAAGFIDGNTLLETCRKKQSIEHGAFLSGYAAASTDFALSELQKKLCIPDRLKLEQVEDMACKYIENHPEKRHVKAHFLVSYALMEAFPCNK